MQTKKKILITGVLGYVATELVNVLTSNSSFEIIGIDNSFLPDKFEHKKLIDELGAFKECFLSKGRDNRNSYFRSSEQIDILREVIELLKTKHE